MPSLPDVENPVVRPKVRKRRKIVRLRKIGVIEKNKDLLLAFLLVLISFCLYWFLYS